MHYRFDGTRGVSILSPRLDNFFSQYFALYKKYGISVAVDQYDVKSDTISVCLETFPTRQAMSAGFVAIYGARSTPAWLKKIRDRYFVEQRLHRTWDMSRAADRSAREASAAWNAHIVENGVDINGKRYKLVEDI